MKSRSKVVEEGTEEWSYADESHQYKGGEFRVRFVGQVGPKDDLNWFERLQRHSQNHQELKSKDAQFLLQFVVEEGERKMILRGMGQSEVYITDPRVYARRIEHHLQTVMGFTAVPPLDSPAWRQYPQLKGWLDSLKKTVAKDALLRSPVQMVGVMARQVSGVTLDADLHDSLESLDVDRIAERLKLRQHAFELASLATAVFSKLCDPEVRKSVITDLVSERQIVNEAIYYQHLAEKVISPNRKIDEGNDIVLRAIQELAGTVNGMVETLYLEFEARSGLKVEKGTSVEERGIAAADIVAGFARCYFQEGGIREVVDRFRKVCYNGKFVRGGDIDEVEKELRHLSLM